MAKPRNDILTHARLRGLIHFWALETRQSRQFVYKHGSWLNLAESELGVLSSQRLNRRMSDKRFLKSEVAAWEADRNKKHTKANWQFTTQDARVELKSLYPSF